MHSPVRTECVMFVMCCKQCCMSVSTGIYMFAIVMCWVLLICILII